MRYIFTNLLDNESTTPTKLKLNNVHTTPPKQNGSNKQSDPFSSVFKVPSLPSNTSKKQTTPTKSTTSRHSPSAGEMTIDTSPTNNMKKRKLSYDNDKAGNDESSNTTEPPFTASTSHASKDSKVTKKPSTKPKESGHDSKKQKTSPPKEKEKTGKNAIACSARPGKDVLSVTLAYCAVGIELHSVRFLLIAR